MAEDLADDCLIVDEGDHTHGTLAPWAFERIDLVDFVKSVHRAQLLPWSEKPGVALAVAR